MPEGPSRLEFNSRMYKLSCGLLRAARAIRFGYTRAPPPDAARHPGNPRGFRTDIFRIFDDLPEAGGVTRETRLIGRIGEAVQRLMLTNATSDFEFPSSYAYSRDARMKHRARGRWDSPLDRALPASNQARTLQRCARLSSNHRRTDRTYGIHEPYYNRTKVISALATLGPRRSCQCELIVVVRIDASR